MDYIEEEYKTKTMSVSAAIMRNQVITFKVQYFPYNEEFILEFILTNTLKKDYYEQPQHP